MTGGRLPRGGRPASALEEIEAGIEFAWQAFAASFAVEGGSVEETSLAEAVLQDPSEFEWRVVDAAMDRLICEDCRSTLGAGPVGCAPCDRANAYRFAAREIDRLHVPDAGKRDRERARRDSTALPGALRVAGYVGERLRIGRPDDFGHKCGRFAREPAPA